MTYPVYSSPLPTLIESDSSPHVINLPALIANGNLILIWSSLNDNVDVTSVTGFSELKDEPMGADNARSGIFAKIADGSEGGTTVSATLSANSAGVWYVAIIGGWFGSLAGVEVSLVADSIDTTLDANAISPSWGAGEDTLYIFTSHMRKGGHSTTYPTGFDSNQANATTVLGSGGASLSIATMESTAASVDPDAVTVSAATSSGAYVLAIRPAVSTTVAIDSVSTGPYREGDSVTFNLSNASATGKTVSIPQGTLTVTAEDANSITATIPDLKTFGDQTGLYDVATVFTVTDGADSDTVSLPISPSDGHYHATVTDAAGYSDLGQSSIVNGDRVYAHWVTGSGDVDLAVGAVSSLDEGVLRIWIQDNADDVWGTSADIQMPHVASWSDWGLINYASYSANTVSIDSIVTTRNSATITYSYPDPDVTSFEYRLDDGAWLSSTSPQAIPSLTDETTYSFSVRPLLDGSAGSATTTTFTTNPAVDVTPNAFSFTSQDDVAREVYRESDVITISGVDAGVDIPISVSNGEYQISVNGGQSWSSYTSAAGNVRLNHRVRVRQFTSSNYSDPKITSLTIGGVVGTFTTTTLPDTEAPVFTLTNGNVSIVEGSTWIEPGFTCVDNADGAIPANEVTVTGSVDTNTPGSYTITYSATDAAGNVGTASRIVTVTAQAPSDSTPPQISLVGGNVTVEEGTTWVEPGYTATDNTDGVLTGSVVVSGTVNTNTPGTYTLTYSVSDAAGNAASVTRTVTVTTAIVYPLDFAAPASRTYVAERLSRVEKGEAFFIKEQDEVLDYDFDLTNWLTDQGDTLPDGNFSIQISGSGLKNVGAGTVAGTNRVKVWLSEGIASAYGSSYAVELTIITSRFRTARFLMRIAVVDRVH